MYIMMSGPQVEVSQLGQKQCTISKEYMPSIPSLASDAAGMYSHRPSIVQAGYPALSMEIPVVVPSDCRKIHSFPIVLRRPRQSSQDS